MLNLFVKEKEWRLKVIRERRKFESRVDAASFLATHHHFFQSFQNDR